MQKEVSPVIDRPLSPHLGIYRWQITSVLSILHRLTGAALAFGTVVLVAWLWAAAYNSETFYMIHNFFASRLGLALLMGWSYAFYFHFCNGIRHLFWDLGKGFEIHTAARTGWLVVGLSIVLTGVAWVMAFNIAGAQP